MKRGTWFAVLPACLLGAALLAHIVGNRLAPASGTKQFAAGQLRFDYPASWTITRDDRLEDFQQVMLMAPTLEFCIVRRVHSDRPPTTREFATEFSKEGATAALEALGDAAPGLAELVVEEPVHGFEHLTRKNVSGLVGALAPSIDHYLSKRVGDEWIFITYSHDAQAHRGILSAFDLITRTAAIRDPEG